MTERCEKKVTSGKIVLQMSATKVSLDAQNEAGALGYSPKDRANSEGRGVKPSGSIGA